MLYDHCAINEQGHLTFGGCDTAELARLYGTPLYLMDETVIRRQARTYVQAMAKHFAPGSMPLYASKACCIKAIYPILQQEGMGADAVSAGELYIALAAGMPPEKLYFHGNAKTREDIRFALEKGVGTFIADNADELRALEQEAAAMNRTARVLLRLTPGIDPHTFAAVNTGVVECKFGVPLIGEEAMEGLRLALSLSHLDVYGLHCHIGSQIFDQEPFCMAVDIMTEFMARAKAELGFVTKTLNLGGGFGVQYVESQPECDIEGSIARVGARRRSRCAALSLPEPAVLMEPGRSIVGAAGATLYTVQSVKCIPGYCNYVAVDGGMADNPRYALYQSPYTVLAADRMNEEADFTCTVAGRCCESGDLIQEGVRLPRLRAGDLLAVLTTGAYNYSMASNYNTLGRPPVVFVGDGSHRTVVRRETFEDMARCML